MAIVGNVAGVERDGRIQGSDDLWHDTRRDETVLEVERADAEGLVVGQGDGRQGGEEGDGGDGLHLARSRMARGNSSRSTMNAQVIQSPVKGAGIEVQELRNAEKPTCDQHLTDRDGETKQKQQQGRRGCGRNGS